MRQSWDKTFFRVALAIAARSECVQARVGAVVVDREHRIVATGYNGKPENFSGCESSIDFGCAVYCPRGAGIGPKADCPSIHAEANALLWGDRRTREGGTIYITRVACRACSKLIANSGLAEVVWQVPDEDVRRVTAETDYLHRSGLRVRTFYTGREIP